MAGVGYEPTGSDEEWVCARVRDLVAMNHEQALERVRIRDLMNNRRALAALLGDKAIADRNLRLPIANLMLRSAETLGRKVGRRPDVKVDPPATTDAKAALDRADKKARVFETYDELCRLELLLPQVGRWLPTYGLTAGIVKVKMVGGVPWPTVEIRDPLQTFPGEWGASQDPQDMAVVWRLSRRKVAELWPGSAHRVLHPERTQSRQWAGGGVLLGSSGGQPGWTPGWASQNGGEVEVAEYYDQRGCWWMLHGEGVLLGYEPNLLSTPAFRVAKRFSVDEVVGAFDHAIGVMAMQARLSLLQATAVEDSVMSETVVIGNLIGDSWKRGRNAVNVLTQGSQAMRMNSQVPFQAFNQLTQLERQVRVATGHSAQDDGEGGSGWTTARGLEQLASSTGLEVQEYQTTLRWWLQEIDGLRGELDEKVCDQVKEMRGVRAGAPFAERYRPSVDLKGDYRTRRVYGAMSGLDDQEKLVGIMQLLSSDLIDTETGLENIDGLENHQKIRERVLADKARKVLLEGLLARAGQGDPSAEEMAAELLPSGDPMRVMVERRAKAAAAAAAQQPASPSGAAPDVKTLMGPQFADATQTVLSRATPGGSQSGSQVLATV